MDEMRDAGLHGGGQRSAEHLRRIADVLGLPVAAFFDGGANGAEFAQAGEILRLWSALDRESDRRKVLALMRALGSGRQSA